MAVDEAIVLMLGGILVIGLVCVVIMRWLDDHPDG